MKPAIGNLPSATEVKRERLLEGRGAPLSLSRATRRSDVFTAPFCLRRFVAGKFIAAAAAMPFHRFLRVGLLLAE